MWRHRRVTELLGQWAHQGVWNHGKPLTWVKGSLCSSQEFESLVEVTASIPGIRMHSPGFVEEGRAREKATGRLLQQRSTAGGAEGTLCFIQLAFPLIPQYL